MTVTIAEVPQISYSIGANEAGQLVEDKFTSAQNYASDAINTAKYYLETLADLFKDIDPPTADIDYSFQDISLVNDLSSLRPEAPSDEALTPETISTPDRPTFSTVTIPTITIPTYDVVDPDIDFNYSDSSYSSDLNTALIAAVKTAVEEGGTGLGEAVEIALWDRARNRTELENERLYAETEEYFAARGYEIPPGMLSGRLLEVTKEINRNNQQLNHEISIEQARLAKEHSQFIISSAIQLEGQEKELFNATAARLLEAAKVAVEVMLSTYKTKVDAYVAKLEASALEVDIEKTKAEVVTKSNENLVAIYQSDIEAYKVRVATELAIIENIAKVYSYKIAGYEADAKAVAVTLDAQIQEYKARVEQANNQTELSLKEAELTLQGYLGATGLTIEGQKAITNISAQLAASALSSVNASASLGDSLSRGVGMQYSHSENINNSASLTDQHYYPHTET
jgi:hypothetical protein